MTDLTSQLWNKFNTDRANLDRDYMSDEKSLSAYMASFLLPNIERVRAVLSHSRMVKKVTQLAEIETIDVLDFGSGPLSATIGLLLAMNDVNKSTGKVNCSTKKIRLTAVERSEKAVRRAQILLEQSLHPSVGIEVERVTAIPMNRSFHVIVAANVLNEIPEKHRFKVINSLLGSMNTETAAMTVIIEPGQDEHSKKLASLRDSIFSSDLSRQIDLIAPCPHKNACPLGPKSQRRDWCWFKTEFDRPSILIELDRRTKLDHSQLAFSWLALGRENSVSGQESVAVCVSDEMPVGHINDADRRMEYFKNNILSSQNKDSSVVLEKIARSGHKTMLCMPTGQLAGGLRLRSESDEKIQRGNELNPSSAFSIVIAER